MLLYATVGKLSDACAEFLSKTKTLLTVDGTGSVGFSGVKAESVQYVVPVVMLVMNSLCRRP